MSSKSKSASKSMSGISSSPEQLAEISNEFKEIIRDKFHIVEDKEDIETKTSSSIYKIHIFDDIMPEDITKKGKRIQLIKNNKIIGDKTISKAEWKELKSKNEKELKNEIKKYKEQIKKNPAVLDTLVNKAEDINVKNVPHIVVQDEQYYANKFNQEAMIRDTKKMANTYNNMQTFAFFGVAVGIVAEIFHHAGDDTIGGILLIPTFISLFASSFYGFQNRMSERQVIRDANRLTQKTGGRYKRKTVRRRT